MKRDALVQWGALGVCAGCLAGAGFTAAHVASAAGRYRLTYADRATDNDPPEVGLGIALGAFRGLFVNMLWIRANYLKEEGKFHEAMTLARAITALQPHFPQVWVFHAWNMAYNISVSTQSPAERWNWVNRGIDLLRGDGIFYNPREMPVYRELGWIFLHKISGYTDESNQYYKRALAGEWTEVLGEPPRLGIMMSEQNVADVRRYQASLAGRGAAWDMLEVSPGESMDRHRASLVYVAWLADVERAPRSMSELTREDAGAGALVEAIRAAVGPEFGLEFLNRYTKVRAYLDSPFAGTETDSFMGAKSAALRGLMQDPAHAEAWPKVLACARRKVLVDRYHMDPSRMIRYTKLFGPMDWRHAASHALYWSRMGVENALLAVDENNKEDHDFINNDRQVMHSIQELYRSGDIYFNYFYWSTPTFRLARTGATQTDTFYSAVPNPHFIDAYGDMMDDVRSRGGKFDNATRIWSFYSAGYENFLQDVTRFYFRRGQRELAAKYQERLVTFPGININDQMKLLNVYAADLNSFIQAQFEDGRFTSPHVAVSELEGSLQGAFMALLAGDDAVFRSCWDYARTYHAAYRERQIKITGPSGGVGRMEMFDRDFREQAGLRFANFISELDTADAERLYARAPNDLRQWAYQMIAFQFSNSTNASVALAGRPFQEVFPEPEGMDEFRAYIKSLQERDVRLTPIEGG